MICHSVQFLTWLSLSCTMHTVGFGACFSFHQYTYFAKNSNILLAIVSLQYILQSIAIFYIIPGTCDHIWPLYKDDHLIQMTIYTGSTVLLVSSVISVITIHLQATLCTVT